MGYRIQYIGRFAEEMMKIPTARKENRCSSLLWIYIGTIVALLVFTHLRYGSAHPVFFPGDSTVTIDAIWGLKNNMAGGIGFEEAFSNFCCTVLEAAT